MTARRKLVTLQETPNPALKRKIERTIEVAGKRKAMLKDAHLLEASLATDQIVVSLDDSARELFRNASAKITELRKITWVNPVPAANETSQWLRRGAKPVRHWQLGN